MTNQEHGNKGPDNTSFVVKDRRRFNAQGTLRAQDPGNAKDKESTVESTATTKITPLDRSDQPFQTEPKQQPGPTQQATLRQEATGRPLQKPHPEPVAEADDHDGDITFSSFVVSLATQASIQLGLLTPPPGMDVPIDLEAAKQTIDILGLVERKTRGNLTEQEKNLLVNVLHELRIGYVKIMKS